MFSYLNLNFKTIHELSFNLKKMVSLYSLNKQLLQKIMLFFKKSDLFCLLSIYIRYKSFIDSAKQNAFPEVVIKRENLVSIVYIRIQQFRSMRLLRSSRRCLHAACTTL